MRWQGSWLPWWLLPATETRPSFVAPGLAKIGAKIASSPCALGAGSYGFGSFFVAMGAGILPGSDVPEINAQNSVKRPAIERQ
jgi:hypothetical protein